MSFPNVYAHRKVAETAMRGCDICFRPTSSVLYSEGADAKVRPLPPPLLTPSLISYPSKVRHRNFFLTVNSGLLLRLPEPPKGPQVLFACRG